MKLDITFSPLAVFELNGYPWTGFCVKHFLETDGHTSSEHFVAATSPEITEAYKANNGCKIKTLSFKKHNNVILRIHSECFLGDVLNASTCDCGLQLQNSIERIQSEGVGVIIYLRQEARGIGLFQKMHAINLPQNLDTFRKNEYLGFKADHRHYGLVIKILEYLEISSVTLLTGNPGKIETLRNSHISFKLEPFNYADANLNLSPKAKAELKAKLDRGFHYITKLK